MTEKQVITTVEEFSTLLQNLSNNYDKYVKLLKECNDRTTDYNHKLELDNLDYYKRAKLTTIQRKNLQNRRKYKNMIEILDPLMKWRTKPSAAGAINHLNQTLVQLRKVKQYHETRSYTPRVKEE